MAKVRTVCECGRRVAVIDTAAPVPLRNWPCDRCGANHRVNQQRMADAVFAASLTTGVVRLPLV